MLKSLFNLLMLILKVVFAKNDWGYRLTSLIVIATNLTSICCVYKEKIAKNDSYRRTERPYKFRKLEYSTRIVK